MLRRISVFPFPTKTLRKTGAALFAACALLAPTVSSAQDFTRYRCDINHEGQRGFLPPDAFLFVSSGAEEIMAFDGIIHSVNDEQPIAAKITKRSGDTVTFSYLLRLRSNRGTLLRVRYTGSLTTSNGAYTIQARLVGGGSQNQRQFGRGTCRPS